MNQLLQSATKLPVIDWTFTFFGGHIQTVKNNWQYPEECHAAYEIIYVLNGIEQITCFNNDYLLTAGEFAIISPGTYHTVTAINDLTYFCFHFDLDEPEFEERLISNPKIVYKKSDSLNKNITEHMDQMLNILSSKENEDYEFTDKIALQLLLSEIILILFKDNSTENFTPHKNISGVQIAKTLRAMIKKQMHEQLQQSLADSNSIPTTNLISNICKQLNVSTGHASRLFRQSYGLSPKDYLSKIKKELAQELLLKPQYNINQISELLGYTSAGNFSRQFKSWTDMTPKEFRTTKITHFDKQFTNYNQQDYYHQRNKNKKI